MADNSYEKNRRIVFGKRPYLGIGIQGLTVFCGLMDIVSKFHNKNVTGCFEKVLKAAETVYDWSVRNAVDQEKAETLEKKPLRHYFDSFWRWYKLYIKWEIQVTVTRRRKKELSRKIRRMARRPP